jgi:DNA-binding transcriptional LysR family regulator
MAMELRHLRYVIAVAEEGHITRAAERLGIAQPPLSRAIKAIEQDIKVQLFRRVPRGVELTAAGRAFLDSARATFTNLDRGLESARRVARGEEGQISVAFTSSTAFHTLVPSVVREFRETFPRVAVTFNQGNAGDLIQQLENGRLDAMFSWLSIVKLEGVVFHPLLEEPMIVALPEDHALGRGRARDVQLKQLAEEIFVMNRQPGPLEAIRDDIISACRTAGFRPRVGQEAPNVIATIPLVAGGGGVSIVPACLRNVNIRGVVYRRLVGSSKLKVLLSLASRRGDTSAVVRQFVNLVRRKAKDFQRDMTLSSGK